MRKFKINNHTYITNNSSIEDGGYSIFKNEIYHFTISHTDYYQSGNVDFWYYTCSDGSQDNCSKPFGKKIIVSTNPEISLSATYINKKIGLLNIMYSLEVESNDVKKYLYKTYFKNEDSILGLYSNQWYFFHRDLRNGEVDRAFKIRKRKRSLYRSFVQHSFQLFIRSLYLRTYLTTFKKFIK